MKISFLIHTLNAGGAERTVVNLGTEFKKMGHVVDIVTYNKGIFYDTGDIKVENILLKNGKRKSRFKVINVFRKIINYRKYITKTNPDIIICLLYPSILYTLFISKRILVIGSERSSPKHLKNIIKRIVRFFLFLSVDGMIFQTERARSYYSKMIYSKGIVIPNSVGNLNIDHANKHVSNKENKIVAVGSFKPEKDYFTLIKAFKLVTKAYPEVILEIYGEGPLRPKIELLIRQLDLTNNVFLMGKHRDAILKIKSARCYVLSSISEGMPNSLMEAMAIGLPCVSTDCENGPRELITHGVNGFLAPVGDHKAISDYIIRILDNDELANTLGKNALNINTTNSNSQIANRYLNFIETLKH